MYIPDTIQEIGRADFSGCNKLKDIILSSSLTSLENDTFEFFTIEIKS